MPAAGEDRWLAVSFPSAEAYAAALGAPPGEDPMGPVAAWARDRDALEAAAAAAGRGRRRRVRCSTRATC